MTLENPEPLYDIETIDKAIAALEKAAMNCTICHKPLAMPDVQGRSHFVCDGRVPPAAIRTTPYGQAMQISQAVADAKWTPFQQRQVDASDRRMRPRPRLLHR
jgi:hypothetical protein